jgi:bifunctional non-homologous end joining protein LigD
MAFTVNRMSDQLNRSGTPNELAHDHAMALNYSRVEVPNRRSASSNPMLLLRTDQLPEGPNQSYELKLDGYRALAIKTGGRVKLRSRNDNDFSARYPAIVKALSAMPNETVIDGEVVALDESGRPSFNLLQNYGSAGAPLIYYVFDVVVLKG